jgi:hypothetical protein
VLLLTENPPHTQITIWFPITGIAVTIFVITVAPQKLICPQGKVYPRNAIPAIKMKITTPELQTHCLGARKDW